MSSLAEAKRQATLDVVLAGVRRHVLSKGIDATMDELAEASGVSRATLFRLFGSRDKLLADAFRKGMEDYVQALPRYDGDVDGWLRAMCDTIHRMNAVAGRGFWELTSRSDLSPELAATERRRRRGARATTKRVAETLWEASDHRGEPPPSLVNAVGAFLSTHFTAAVLTDVGERHETAGRLAYDAIRSALDSVGALDAADD